MTAESLDSILSGRDESAPAPEPVVTETPPQETQETQAAEPTTDSQTNETEGKVPIAALHAERQKAKRYTEQVAEFQTTVERLRSQNSQLTQQVAQLVASLQKQQPAPEKPDFWQDPDNTIQSYVQQGVQPLQQAQQAIVENFSRMLAVKEHGQEVVGEAYKAMEARLQSDPSARVDYSRIMSSPDPWGELVSWHKKQTVLEEIGTDPNAYREKLKAELMAELQGKQQTPAPVLPSNIAGARNVGTRSGPAWAGPTPLTDIFKR